MKIIKEGDPDGVKRRVRFHCKRCGCVFEADSGEYTTIFRSMLELYLNEESYSCQCPTCSAVVTSS